MRRLKRDACQNCVHWTKPAWGDKHAGRDLRICDLTSCRHTIWYYVCEKHVRIGKVPHA